MNGPTLFSWDGYCFADSRMSTFSDLFAGINHQTSVTIQKPRIFKMCTHFLLKMLNHLTFYEEKLANLQTNKSVQIICAQLHQPHFKKSIQETHLCI